MIEIHKSMLLVEFVLLACFYWYAWRHYQLPYRRRHVRVIGAAFLLLAGVDIWTIWIEEYPAVSAKAFAMQAGFGSAIYALWHLLFFTAGRPDDPDPDRADRLRREIAERASSIDEHARNIGRPAG